MLVAIGGKEEASATPPLPPRPCIYAREKWRRGEEKNKKNIKRKENSSMAKECGDHHDQTMHVQSKSKLNQANQARLLLLTTPTNPNNKNKEIIF